MKTLVVGAGAAGLVTLKEFREAGLDCTAAEFARGIGGNFDIHRPDAVVYDSARLTTSNYFMAFSSLAPDLEEPRRFWLHGEYMDYLRRFARHFGLLQHIRFETTVRGIRLVGDALDVEVTDGQGTRVERYDAVAVCTGSNRIPRLPDVPGLDDFPGEVLHSTSYRNPAPFAGQRVLVIGMGETGADVANEVSRVASAAMVSVRRAPAIIERYPGGSTHPSDAYTSRALHSLPLDVLQRRQLAEHLRNIEARDSRYTAVLTDWVVRSGGILGQWLTKTEAAVRATSEGRLDINFSGLARFDGRTAVFRDGASFEADTVICCTGYAVDWPCPEFERRKAHEMFKNAFMPDIGPRLSFIGWVRPDVGGAPMCAELQARYLAQLLSGRLAVPDRETMHATIARDQAERRARFYNASLPETVVGFAHFCDGLARLIGCHPLESGRLRDPVLLERLWFGSMVAAQYRLFGPGADFEGARKVLMRLPVAWTRKQQARLGLDDVLSRSSRTADALYTWTVDAAKAHADNQGFSMMPMADTAVTDAPR